MRIFRENEKRSAARVAAVQVKNARAEAKAACSAASFKAETVFSASFCGKGVSKKIAELTKTAKPKKAESGKRRIPESV